MAEVDVIKFVFSAPPARRREHQTGGIECGTRIHLPIQCASSTTALEKHLLTSELRWARMDQRQEDDGGKQYRGMAVCV
jgi:hypothetical protein